MHKLLTRPFSVYRQCSSKRSHNFHWDTGRLKDQVQVHSSNSPSAFVPDCSFIAAPTLSKLGMYRAPLFAISWQYLHPSFYSYLPADTPAPFPRTQQNCRQKTLWHAVPPFSRILPFHCFSAFFLYFLSFLLRFPLVSTATLITYCLKL